MLKLKSNFFMLVFTFQCCRFVFVVCRVYGLCVWRSCCLLHVFSREFSTRSQHVLFHWTSLCHVWGNVFSP